ncbi:MAG: deoxyguanosinetriphosphate triphosphohydrolase, partial [Candidatus Brocadiales bacterium]
FEHNLHGLRVVDVLEKRYPGFPGLNLSWELRESIVKHDAGTNTVKEFRPEERPLLEAQVVEKADSIAYDNHDLDDGLKAGLITEEDLESVELWHFASENVDEKWNGLDKGFKRAQTIIFLINLEVTDLIENAQRKLERLGIRSVEDVRACKETVVEFSPELSEQKKRLQDFMNGRVYSHYRVVRMSDKAKRFVEDLFRIYVDNPRQLPPEFQQWVEDAGLYQAVCDYIAGMTDRYVQDEYRKLFYPYERV